MSWRLLALVRKALTLVLLLVTAAGATAPPKVVISGQVYDANGLAASGTRVTFKTIGVQALPDADKTVIPPTTFTTTVGSNGQMTPVEIPKQMVVEVQVGRSQPRTVYTGTESTTTLGYLLQTYNPEIPIGVTIPSGGGGGSETVLSFATETRLSAGQTVYVSPGGAVSETFAEAVFPAGSGTWSELSCVMAGTTAMTATATLLAGSCGTETPTTQTVSSVNSTSVLVSTGAAVSTTASQCVSLKLVTTGTGVAAFVNCSAKRAAT